MFNIDYDEDVENNFHEDTVPDILNPYLDTPKYQHTIKDEQAFNIVGTQTSKSAPKRKKMTQLVPKMKLFVSTSQNHSAIATLVQ
ncbi:developmentally-regulated protein [Acrasis kona]|uniref:Developmentally-regulated protein n=1 Tax=Acrasis kona TaxID=1008807 RepID=A0AAW2YPT2_9EUKA